MIPLGTRFAASEKHATFPTRNALTECKTDQLLPLGPLSPPMEMYHGY
jgi:hypothetical protein